MAYIELSTNTISSISWTKTGLSEYKNYDYNTSFFTPNNVNEILSCITNHKDMISSIIPQVNECVRTVNSITPINGNIDLNTSLTGVISINNASGILKLLYNNEEIQGTKIADYTEFSLKSPNTITNINNINDGNISIVDSTGNSWPTITTEKNTTITINANYTTIDSQSGNVDFYSGDTKLSVTDGKITIPAIEQYVSTINNYPGKFIFQKNGINVDLLYDQTTKTGTINYTIPTLIYDGVPVGTIISWCGPWLNIPAGWHVCDGTEIDSTYTELIALIGANYPLLTDGKYIQYGSEVDITNTAAGLPNISGLTYTTNCVIRPDNFCDGVFKNSKVYDNSLSKDETPEFERSNYMGYLSFNAASGQINKDGTLVTDPDKVIYGKSDTVTPYHMTLLPLIKCCSPDNISELNIANIQQLTTEINTLKQEIANLKK